MNQNSIGILGEDFIAQWLQTQGWVILSQRWRCQWGEIDIITQQPQPQPPPCLVFVEVKTRRQGNWDANGLLSITPQKQARLWQAAQLFLAAHPELAENPCRFDVALVHYQKNPRKSNQDSDNYSGSQSHSSPLPVAFLNLFNLGNSPIIADITTETAGFRLILKQYIQSAFEF